MVYRLDLEPVEVPREHYVRRVGHSEDVDRVIAEDVDIYVGGDLTIVYRHQWMPENESRVWIDKLNSIEFNHGARSAGMRSLARTFGYLPRRTMRGDFCHVSQFDQTEPETVDALKRVAGLAADAMLTASPVLAHWQLALLNEQVLSEYRMETDLPFTSGIINCDTSLMFHRDSGNFPGTWSAMLGLKRNIREGTGVLVIPELRTALEIGDGSLTMFDGKKWWHAVSPIRKARRDGKRYTVVFYAIQQLKNCLPWDEEMARAVNIRTLRERRRAGLIE